MPLIEAAWIGSAGAVGAISITGAGKGPSGGPLFVTPVADAAGHLKVIAWELDDLQVHRRGDSGTLSPAIPVDLIASCASPADDGLAVTAVRDSASHGLRLLYWSLGAEHAGKLHPVVAYEGHDAGGGHVVENVVLTRCSAGVVTAVLRGDHRLSLAVWDYVEFSPKGKPTLGPHRIGHSDTSVTGTALAVVEWSDGIVTAVRDSASGDLHLHAWKIGANGSIAQMGTATAGPIDDVSAVALSETRLVTVQKLAKSHELEAIVWDLSNSGATITRRGSIVAPPPAAIHAGPAVCNLFADILITTEIAPAQVAVAAREANGHLKITLWDVNAHGDFVLKSDAAFDPVDEVAMTFAGSGSRQTTEGEKTPTSQALVAARRADGDLGLFLLVAANDDVLPDIPGWASVDFTMQHQQQSKWCWAATSTSVAHFFKPSTGWTQCKVANHIKGRSDCCGSGASGPCNDGDSLEDALNVVDHLNYVEGDAASYDNVQGMIAAGLPVPVRTAWSGGGAHFIAIVGYEEAEERLLTIADPISGVSVWDYPTFKTAYRHSGTWTDTYYVKP